MTKSRKYLFILITLALLMLVAELGLRVYFHYANYQVGSLAPGWLAVGRVDSLEVSHSYYTDATGIFRADPIFWKEKGIEIDNNGFRGYTDTRKHDTLLPKVLLIGDSYTWGAGASNLKNSFADQLNDSGRVIYNTGIPGADPSQYALIADSFVPRLHPAITLVVLYMGNDLMEEYRQPLPYQPLYYVTNTGWLPGYYNGHYFPSADASYSYYLHLYTPQSMAGKLMAKSALGTLLLSVPLRLREREAWNKRKELSITNSYLKRIAETCKKYQSKLAIFVIPYSGTDLIETYKKDPKKYLLKQYPNTFTGLENVVYPLPMIKDDYLPLPDGHFNNAGHKKAAEYIRLVLGK